MKNTEPKWRVEYTDGRGVCDESWDVTDGKRFFECFEAESANWLCGVLNEREQKQFDQSRTCRTCCRGPNPSTWMEACANCTNNYNLRESSDRWEPVISDETDRSIKCD